MVYNETGLKQDGIVAENKKQAFKEGNMDNTGKINTPESKKVSQKNKPKKNYRENRKA